MISHFIAAFPEVAAVLIGLLFTALVGFIAWWVRIIRQKIVDHTHREETITWPAFEDKITKISSKLQENHVKYIEVFGSMDTRLALLEATNKKLDEVVNAVNHLSELIGKR